MADRSEQDEIIPNDNDVLCGSGSMKAVHPGNQRFLRLVAKHYAEYEAATSKADKMKASRRIMREVLLVGTRFLKRDTGSQKWYVADLRVGKDKMSHCLRDIRKKRKRDNWAKDRQDNSIGAAAAAAIATLNPIAGLPQTMQISRAQQDANKAETAVHSSIPSSFAPPLSKATMLHIFGTKHQAGQKQQSESDTGAIKATNANPSSASLQDTSTPLPWDGASRSWAANQRYAQNPLLLEFSANYNDEQDKVKQWAHYKGAAPRNTFSYHPSQVEQEEPRQEWYPPERGTSAASWSITKEEQHFASNTQQRSLAFPENDLAHHEPVRYQWPSSRRHQQYSANDQYSHLPPGVPNDSCWTSGILPDNNNNNINDILECSTFSDWRPPSPGRQPG